MEANLANNIFCFQTISLIWEICKTNLQVQNLRVFNVLYGAKGGFMPIITLSNDTVQTPVAVPGAVSTDGSLGLAYTGTENINISLEITGEDAGCFTAELYRVTSPTIRSVLVATTGSGGSDSGVLASDEEGGVRASCHFQIIFNAPTKAAPNSYSAKLTVIWGHGESVSTTLSATTAQITLSAVQEEEPTVGQTASIQGIQIDYASFDSSVLQVVVAPATWISPLPTGLIVGSTTASLPPVWEQLTNPKTGEPGAKILVPLRSITIYLPITYNADAPPNPAGLIPVQVTPQGWPQLNPAPLYCGWAFIDSIL